MTITYTLLCAVKVAACHWSDVHKRYVDASKLNINQNGPVTTKTQGGRSLN